MKPFALTLFSGFSLFSATTLAGPTPITDPAIYDVNGHLVGKVIDIAAVKNSEYPYAKVLVSAASGRAVIIRATRQTLTGSEETPGDNNLVFFQSSDCSGTGYIGTLGSDKNPYAAELAVPGHVVGPTKILYAPGGGPANTLPYLSRYEGKTCVVPDPGVAVVAVKAIRVGTLSNFVPPFILR